MPVESLYANPGAYHLASNPTLYEPQRSNNFELQVEGLENLRRINTGDLDSNSTIQNSRDVINFSVVSVDVPAFSQDPIEVAYGNNKIKFAGKPSWSVSNLVINDFIGADGKSVLLSWQALSYNPSTQKVGSAADYKKTAYLMEYTPDYKLVRSWKLIGCWLSEVTVGSFDMATGDKKTVTAQVQYDYAIMEMAE